MPVTHCNRAASLSRTCSNCPPASSLFALEEDLRARGIEAPPRVTRVDYPAFVALCIRFDKVNSWL